MPGNRPFKLSPAGNRHFNRVLRWRAARAERVTKRLRTSARRRRYAHVLGHNFAPFAFQEPCFGFIVVNMTSYTFVPGSNVCHCNERRVCCWKMLCSGDGTPPHGNAAAYGDEVSVPDLECSNRNSDWWYMYTSTMSIKYDEPCVPRGDVQQRLFAAIAPIFVRSGFACRKMLALRFGS